MKKIIFSSMVIFLVVLGVIFGNDSNNDDTYKVVNYNGSNLRISVDGVQSSTLPTSGNYYLSNYDCKSEDTKLSWNRISYELEVTNGTEESGVSCYVEFESNPKLSDVAKSGDYVAYTGNNGCVGEACNGQNANYVNDTDMGYCENSAYKFHVNGWRVGYVKNDSAYLISAGAPECMCTSSDGSYSNSSCSSYETTSGAPLHLANLDKVALKYCNTEYVKNGVCNDATAWAMDVTDFSRITGHSFCSAFGRRDCGYTNDLIDISGVYWLAQTPASDWYPFVWDPAQRIVDISPSSHVFGVRSVLYLDSTVIVTGGSGTYEDPYQIANNYFRIDDGTGYLNADDNLSEVELALATANDVTSMCISVDSSVCTDYIDFASTYTLDLSDENDGEHLVYAYYKDANDNIVASMSRKVIIDTVAPSNNSVTINETDGMARTLTISSTGADYMCFSNTSNSASNCTNWVDYTTSYKWWLAEGTGSKTIYAFFKDTADNIVSVSVSTTCTNDCEYKYFMDAYNLSTIYLMRNDGATAKASNGAAELTTWYSEGSQAMNVCGAYNYSANGYIWCIGNDNNAYYKSSYNMSSWKKVSVSSYFDVDTYNYSIYPYEASYAYVVRSDGKTNRISTSGLANTSWSYGYSTNMATCSGYSSTRVVCVGTGGTYYYRIAYNTSTAYSSVGSGFGLYGGRTNENTWIDMYSNSNVDVIEYVSGGSPSLIANTRIAYNATSASWVSSTAPGDGTIRTCTSTGYSEHNLCLSGDGILYWKSVSTTGWAQRALVFE